MDYIASIGIGTGLDLSGLYAGLQQIQSVKVPRIHVVPTIDHSGLHSLNQHLTKKVEHTKAVNVWMKRNPVKVLTDVSELKALGLELDKFKSKFSSVDLKVNVSGSNSSDLEKVGQKIANSVGDAIAKTMSQSLPSKLLQGLGSGVSVAIENTIGSVFRGAFENIGRELSGGLTKGIVAALENAMGNTIGSTELLGEGIGKALSDAIAQKLPKELKTDLQSVFKEVLGEAEIVTASRSVRGRQRQQRRISNRLAQNEVTIERRDSLRELRSLQQQDEAIKEGIGKRQQAYEKGRDLQERLQSQQRLPGLSDKDFADISKTLNRVNEAIEGLIAEETQLMEEQEQLAKRIEQAKEQVKRTKEAQSSIAPQEQPKAYMDAIKRLTGGDIADELIPTLVVDDKALKAAGAKAKYSIERNAITVTEDLHKAIQSGVFNRDQLESLYHELQHGVQTGFGSFKGIQAFKRGDILNQPVKVTGKEMRAIAPFINQYDPSQRLSETDAEIVGRRQADMILREGQRQVKLTQLSNLTGNAGSRYEQLSLKQSSVLKTKLSQTLELARKTGVEVSGDLKEIINDFTKLQSDINKTIDNIAIAPQDLDIEQIDELEENIKKQLKQFSELSARLDGINETINSKINIPVQPIKVAEKELVATKNQVQASAEANNRAGKASSSTNANPRKLIEEAAQPGREGVIRAKEISASFRTAYSQLKKALAEDNQALAQALAETIRKNADIAKKEIKQITYDLGDEAKFGTSIGSQLANTKGQIGRASKLSQQAIARYKPPSTIPDPWNEEGELEAKRLLEVQNIKANRSMNPSELKQVEELNQLLKNAVKASDEFDLAFKQANRSTTKAFKESSAAVEETIKQFEQGVEPVNELEQQIGGFSKTIYNSVKALFLFSAALAIAPKLVQLGQQAYQTSKQFDSLDRSIKFSAGSESEGVKNLEYIRTEVDRLNAPVKEATESFNQLAGALAGTKLEKNTQEIFTALNEAALVRQLTPEQRNRFFYGVTQAATKPTLSSEEVNQQIGEAFAGSQNIFARAYGESPETFRTNLATGQYSGSEAVLKFARQLRIEFSDGVEDAANSTQALENRLANTSIELQRTLGNAIMPFVNTGLKALNAGLGFVNDNMDTIGLILTGLIATQVPGAIAAIATLTVKLWGLLASQAAVRGGFLVLGKTFLEFGIQTALITAGLKAAFDTWQSFKGSEVLDSAIEKNIKQFKRLEEAASGAAKGTQKTFNDLDRQLNRDRNQSSFTDRFLRNLNPISRIQGTYNQFQSGIRTKSRQDDIRSFNQRVNTTLANSQVQFGDADRARELSKLISDPFIANYEREIYAKQKEAIDTRVRTQREMVSGLLEAANAEIEAIDEAWARNEISRKQADILKAEIKKSIPALESAKKELDNFTDGQVSLIKLVREQLQKTVAALTDTNTLISRDLTRATTQIDTRKANGELTPGAAQFATYGIQQDAYKAQIEVSKSAIASLSKYVRTPDNLSFLFSQGINPETVGAAELERLSALTTKPEEKLLFERLTKIRELEGQVDQYEQQLAQSKAEAAQQLYELSKSVDEYLRSINRQTEDLTLSAQAAQSQMAMQAEKNRLMAKLQSFQSNFFSGFVDSLIGGLDAIAAVEQANVQRQQQELQNRRQYEDTYRQGFELSRQLPNEFAATTIKLDIDSALASQGVIDLKADIAGAVGITRDLNSAVSLTNVTLTQTASAGEQLSTTLDGVSADLKGWSKFLADVGYVWNYVQKEFQVGTKENLELQQRLNNSKRIPGILMERLSNTLKQLVTPGINKANESANALAKSMGLGDRNTKVFADTLKGQLNQALGASVKVGAELVKVMGGVPSAIARAVEAIPGLDGGLQNITETVKGVGQAIIDWIGGAIAKVQEGLSGLVSMIPGQGGQQAQAGMGDFANTLAQQSGMGKGDSRFGYASPSTTQSWEQVLRGSISKGQTLRASRDKGRRLHSGIDLDATEGLGSEAPVQVMFPGTVENADVWGSAQRDNSNRVSTAIRVRSALPGGGTFIADYGHLIKSSFLVKQGQRINAGTKLGRLANGGDYGSTGGHVDIKIQVPTEVVRKAGIDSVPGRLPGHRYVDVKPFMKWYASQVDKMPQDVKAGGNAGAATGGSFNIGAIPKGLTQKGQRYAQLLNNPNIRALLDTVAKAEGADYNTLYGGSKLSNLSQHPNKVVRKPGWIPSSAAGRYQFMNYTWFGRSKQRPGPGIKDVTGVPDFSPTSQDIAAIALLDEAGILRKAAEGDINGIWRQLGRIWASFEGNPYGQGTPQGRRRSAIPYFQQQQKIYKSGAASGAGPTNLLSPSSEGLNRKVQAGQSQALSNQVLSDRIAQQQQQQELDNLKTRGEQEQRNRIESLRQSTRQLQESVTGFNRQSRDLGLAIGDATPLREFESQLNNISDTYADARRNLLEFQRQAQQGVAQAEATLSELTAPGYQAQPGQDIEKDIAATRGAIASGKKALQEVNAIIGQLDDQEKRRQAFEKERFAREERLRRLAARDMITQEQIAAKQEQLRKAQLVQQRNPRDFSAGDPLALQAEIELMQRLLPLDQKRRQLAEDLRVERIKPDEYKEAIALLNQQEKALIGNTEAAKQFGLEERRLQFREQDFAFLQRQNQASGALTQAQLQAAELFQQTRPFDTSQGDPAVIRYGQTVLQIEEERQRQVLEQQRFALTNGNRSQEELNAILTQINQAADKRLENARIELQQTQSRVEQERLDFELRRKQQNQQSDLAVLQSRASLLSAVGIDSTYLNQGMQTSNAQMQFESGLRELEKTRALTNLTADDYERQKSNLEQVLRLQKEQSAIATQQADFARRAEVGNLRADILEGNGAEFTARRMRKELAIAQQNMNFSNQIAQLEQLKGTIPDEELNKMRDYLVEINKLKLDQIKQQFVDLSREIELTGRDATKNFFKGFLVEGKGVFESLKDAFNQMKNQIMSRLIDVGIEAIFKGRGTGSDTGGGLLGSILGSIIGGSKKSSGMGASSLIGSVLGVVGGGSPLGFLNGVLGFSEGGIVPGNDTGSDSVPAMLRSGEFVMSREGVSNLGQSFLSSVNSGNMQMTSYQQKEYSSGEPTQRSSSISIQYEKIGDRDYVTREQFEEGVRYAAQQGAQGGAKITSNWLRNSPSERRRHGI